MKPILYNAIRCKHCGDVIESLHRHDYVACSCGACAVDGGHDYLRRVFKHARDEDYEELSTWNEEWEEEDEIEHL